MSGRQPTTREKVPCTFLASANEGWGIEVSGEKARGGCEKESWKGDRNHLESQGNCERGERRRMSILRPRPLISVAGRKYPKEAALYIYDMI